MGYKKIRPGLMPRSLSFLLRVEKFTDEILLSFAGDFRCFGGDVTAVAVEMGAFLDLEEAELHTSLGGHIPFASFALDEVSVLPEPFKEALLADIDAVLFQDLRHFAYEDSGIRRRDGIGKEDFRLVRFDFGVEFFDGFELGAEHGAGGFVGMGKVVLDEGLGAVDIAAGLADGGQDFVGDPAFEGFGFGLAAAEDEGIETCFVDDSEVLLSAKGVT